MWPAGGTEVPPFQNVAVFALILNIAVFALSGNGLRVVLVLVVFEHELDLG